MELTKVDFDSFAYQLMRVAMFHTKPLDVVVDGWYDMSVGHGLGGYSHTIFERGEGCILCGRCCAKCSYRRTWWWHETEDHPEDVEAVDVSINNQLHRFYVHMTRSGKLGEPCDYLVKLDDLRWGCSLHIPNRKTVHCRSDPFMQVRSVRLKDRKVDLLSRRLYSRNWAWPQCPIDVANTPLSLEVIKEDRRNFDMLLMAYGGLSNSKMLQGIVLWEELLERRPSGNVLFEEVLRA